MKKWLWKWFLRSVINEAKSQGFRQIIMYMKSEWIEHMQKMDMTPEEINVELSFVFTGYEFGEELRFGNKNQ